MVHAQVVGVKSHGGLQVVQANQPQVALPQLPAPPLLHLQTQQRVRGQRLHTAKLPAPGSSPRLGAGACVGVSVPPTGTSCCASSSTAPSGRSERGQTQAPRWRTARTAARPPTADLRAEVT